MVTWDDQLYHYRLHFFSEAALTESALNQVHMIDTLRESSFL